MATFDPRERLQAFTKEDWLSAQRVVEKRRFTLAQASVEQQFAPERLLAFMLCLEADDLGRLFHRVYHSCEAHPVKTLPFRAGLPVLPFRCPECERTVESADELGFDVECAISSDRLEVKAR